MTRDIQILWVASTSSWQIQMLNLPFVHWFSRPLEIRVEWKATAIERHLHLVLCQNNAKTRRRVLLRSSPQHEEHAMCPQPHRMVHHQDLFPVQGPLAHVPARTSNATLSDSFGWSVTRIRIGKASADPLISFPHFQLSTHTLCTLIIFDHLSILSSLHRAVYSFGANDWLPNELAIQLSNPLKLEAHPAIISARPGKPARGVGLTVSTCSTGCSHRGSES